MAAVCQSAEGGVPKENVGVEKVCFKQSKISGRVLRYW